MPLRIEIARSLEELEALRPALERLPWEREEAEYAYFVTRLRLREEARAPFAVVVFRDGEPVAGLVARAEERPLVTAVGYRNLYAPRVRILQLVDGGIAVFEPETIDALVGVLRSALAAGEADAVAVPPLGVSSELFEAFASLGSPLARQRFLAPWAINAHHEGGPLAF